VKVSDIIITSPLLTMTDFVRRLVSGDRARFKDEKLDLELGEPYTNSPSPKPCSTLSVGGISLGFTSKISHTSRIG